MLHVVFPFTRVALLLLVVNIFALAMCLVVHEVAVVRISVRVREATLSVCLTIADVTRVGGTIRPVQRSLTVRYEEQVSSRAPRFREVRDNVTRSLANNFHLTRVGRTVWMNLEVLLCN